MDYIVFAAYTANDSIAHNVWGTSKAACDLLIADRKANGEAFEGEHTVRVKLSFYNRERVKAGFPPLQVVNMDALAASQGG